MKFNISDTDEFRSLIQQLRFVNDVFYQLWLFGEFDYSKLVDTAAVIFDTEGQVVKLIVNQEFWDELNKISKFFVLCHESYHVILNHGVRAKDKLNKDPVEKWVANGAMDLVINEICRNEITRYIMMENPSLLEDTYLKSFINVLSEPLKNIWWYDKYNTEIAKKSKEVDSQLFKLSKENGFFEYNYNLIKKNYDALSDEHEKGSYPDSSEGEDEQGDSDDIEGSPFNDGSFDWSTVDDHSNLPEIPEDRLNQLIEDLVDNSYQRDVERVKEDIENIIGNTEKAERLYEKQTEQSIDEVGDKEFDIAGEKPGEKIISFDIKDNIKEVTTWKSLFKKEVVREESWVEKQRWETDRRHMLLKNKTYLPTKKPMMSRVEAKCDVAVFLDSSGSCKMHSKRFLKAIRSIPEKHFDIDLYCFDRKVYNIDKNINKLYGYGGTSFDIIEERLQHSDRPYPSLVLILTDGKGNKVKPEFPEKWVWLLTYNNSKRYIPKESEHYLLKEYYNP